MAAGGVAVFPADTVYGLCCDPANARAVRRLYERKGRPSCAACRGLVLCARLPTAGTYRTSSRRERFAVQALLPGPATLLLPNRGHRFPLACGPRDDGADTLGLRVPSWCPQLTALGKVHEPVLQSSANLSGRSEARSLHDVPTSIRSGADLVLDGGELPGIPSTVLDLREYAHLGQWRIVREGALPVSAVERALA